MIKKLLQLILRSSNIVKFQWYFGVKTMRQLYLNRMVFIYKLKKLPDTLIIHYKDGFSQATQSVHYRLQDRL